MINRSRAQRFCCGVMCFFAFGRLALICFARRCVVLLCIAFRFFALLYVALICRPLLCFGLYWRRVTFLYFAVL